MKKSLVSMVLVLIAGTAAQAFPGFHHRPPPPPPHHHHRPPPPPFHHRGW